MSACCVQTVSIVYATCGNMSRENWIRYVKGKILLRIYTELWYNGYHHRKKIFGRGWISLKCRAQSTLLSMNKKTSEQGNNGKSQTAEHIPERTIFMNMCMLVSGDQILALDKVGKNYSGTTFPGGHVEPGETFAQAVVREMQEETGYIICDPVLRGIYHWYRDGVHNVGLLYRATQFHGELKSSEEGRVYWISRTDYEEKELAAGMRQVLKIMDDDCFTECYMDLKSDGSVVEYMF